MIKRQQFFFNMTAKDYQAMINGQAYKEMMDRPRQPVQKESKYHNKKIEMDGITFDSKKEYSRWLHLKALETMGLISDLQRQVPFELQPKFTNNKGQHIRAINYVADFTYTKNGKKIVEDVKGGAATQTDVFKLKMKMFEYKYPEYEFTIF